MPTKRKGLQFEPTFFKKNKNSPTVWETVEWEKRNSVITGTDGETVFEMNDVEVPASWSQLATDIAASKYFRKAGVPNERGHEYSVKQLTHRVARTIAEQGKKAEYFRTAKDAEAFENDLKWLLLHQHGAFNSPVYFNVGIFHEYRIKGNGENYAWDGKGSYRPVKNQYERPQGSACFIQSVNDDLNAIFTLMRNEAKLFKYGSGTGSNMSCLRGANEPLSGGGKSSGLLSFLKVLDSAAGAIKSGGTTRRAAVMRCLNADHPEVVDFIEWKVREEAKARALVEKGYSSDFNGEAYATISGQNSNNSVRLTDGFMAAVEKDADWSTRNRTDGSIYETFKARWLFDKICAAAWECADPGVQFDSTVNAWHTCLNSFPIRASNPCSEYMFVDDSACNLASLNLRKFFAKGAFDVDTFKKACRIFLTAQEILVDFGSYPTAAIAKNSHDFRPLGLGFANLGTLMMMAGHPYDSDEGRAIAGLISAILTGYSYEVSAELAEAMGAFERYEENREVMLRIMGRHRDALKREEYINDTHPVIRSLYEGAQECWDNAIRKGESHGYRNAQVSVLAPTGTIGLLMDCATTGVEPAYSLVMWKKLAGGGVIALVNQSVKEVLKGLEYTEEQIAKISQFIQDNSTIEGADELKKEHLAIFDCAISGPGGKREIAPMGHVKMMAAVQPFISGAISKTINIPNRSTVEDIRKIFLDSWKLGIKAITVYRDGSKGSQPLNTEPEKKNDDDLETINYLKGEIGKLHRLYVEQRGRKALDWGISKRLPNERSGRTWEIKVGGTKVFLRSGENTDGSLGEIFVDLGYKEGSTVRALMNQLAISISFSLQHGVPLEKLVERFSFTKFEPHGRVEGHPYLKNATSLIDAIFRVLGHYYLGRVDFLQVKPDEKSPKQTSGSKKSRDGSSNETLKPVATAEHAPCGDCGSIEFLRTGTCYVCIVCGASQGCS